jgi:hypothetical protein
MMLDEVLPFPFSTPALANVRFEDRPSGTGLQPPLEIVESASKMDVGQTRSGTVTQIPPAQAAGPSVPSVRTRSGTITQDTFKSAAPPLIDLALFSNKVRRDSNLAFPTSRMRSDTIRPAIIARTSTGALVGLQTLPGPSALVPQVPQLVPPVPEDIPEPTVLDDQGLFDTEFDPDPEDLLVFSSAKNPDVDDFDFDLDDDHTTRPAQPDGSMDHGAHRTRQMSVQEDSLNLGNDSVDAMSPIRDDIPRRPATSRSRQTKIRWVAPPSKPGKRKEKENRRPMMGPKASSGFKRALGLGRGNGVRSNSKGKGASLEWTENESSPHQSPSSSTDPIDFLTPLDDLDSSRSSSPADAPIEASGPLPAIERGKTQRRKSFSARLEGIVPGKG